MWKRREKMSVRGKKINVVVRYHLKSDANKIKWDRRPTAKANKHMIHKDEYTIIWIEKVEKHMEKTKKNCKNHVFRKGLNQKILCPALE